MKEAFAIGLLEFGKRTLLLKFLIPFLLNFLNPVKALDLTFFLKKSISLISLLEIRDKSGTNSTSASISLMVWFFRSYKSKVNWFEHEGVEFGNG